MNDDDDSVHVVVDKAAFLSVGRILKKVFRPSVKMVVITVQHGAVSIEFEGGGTKLPCTHQRSLVAKITGKHFASIIAAHFQERSPKGQITLTFRPAFREFATPLAGAKCRSIREILPRAYPKVVVLDDEPCIREVYRDLLKTLLPVNMVRILSDPHEALATILRKGAVLLITDINHGQPSCAEMFQRVTEKKKTLSVLVVSGSTFQAEALGQRLNEWPGLTITFLAKPFALSDLTNSVRLALERSKVQATQK